MTKHIGLKTMNQGTAMATGTLAGTSSPFPRPSSTAVPAWRPSGPSSWPSPGSASRSSSSA